MIRYLKRIFPLIFCLLIASAVSFEEKAQEEFFLSTPEQIAALNSESSYLIGGIISPLSGHPVLRQTDLVAKGAQNVTLSRIYIPPCIPCAFPRYKHNQEDWDKYHLYHHLAHQYKGWQFYPHLKLEFTPRLMEILLTDPNGMSLSFRLSGSTAVLSSPPYALSNVVGDTPNGEYDPRNTRISYEENRGRITVFAPDGTTRFYNRTMARSDIDQFYLLEKEILPNGKILRYRYKNGQPDLVESLDPKEQFVYASIRIDGSPWEDGPCRFTSSSGMTAEYRYQRRPIHAKMKHKYKGGKFEEEYFYTCPPILSSVSAPFYRNESLDYCGRFLLSSYSGRDHVFTALNAGFGDEVQHYRTHKLLLPVGATDSLEPIHELNYQPPIAGQIGGMTTVKNSDGTSIAYHFSKDLLITLIQYFRQNGTLAKEKIFSWDQKNWLQAIEVKDGNGQLFFKKSYEYDRFGNPILEVFSGDLTGESIQESFTTKRTFSEEGRNLLLREESEDGKILSFSYLPGTNLVVSKLTSDRDKIILREFYLYDDCNNLIQKIIDDGDSEEKNNLSDVTERTSTAYRLRDAQPFLHLPEWMEETYWDAGAERPLRKSHFIYDDQGNVAKEEVFDAEGRHAYTICKTYNERGDVLSETNRLGQTTHYTYDAKGRLESSTNFSNRLQTTFRRDAKGRLRSQIEQGDDGILHTAAWEYDFHDRCTQRKDPFQNTICYTYDPLVDEVITTDFPPIASLDGQPIPVSTHSVYDPFGREIAKTDANGNTTNYQYNAYGSPVAIHHPNGSREHFRYTKRGFLASRTDPDGLTTHFTHDVLGRVLSETYVFDNKQIAQETFTYNGFHLLTETDKEGNLKQYTYDGARRKIREDFCGRTIEFCYDTLGRLETICKHNKAHNTLLVHYKKDLEGRILEERKTDLSGRILYKINYSYDADGNQKTLTRFINGIDAIDTCAYDSLGRLTQHIDAKGFVSSTTYDENCTNLLGQKVLQTRATDPIMVTTVETQDALARTVKKEILDSKNTTLSLQEMTYDPHGNLEYRRDHVYENDRPHSIQTVKTTYTSDNRVATQTRAFGTEDARTTTYTYSPSGKMATKTHPDGITLSYRYHPLGFMSHLDSSNGAIHHAFEYNLLGHLTDALDENSGAAIKRRVDPFGNVLHETFPSGLQVKKEYDQFDRLTSLKIDNQGEVLYTYDPLFLKAAARISNTGNVSYEHIYEEYDLDGNLLSESLIGNLGQVVHATDPRHQKTSISSPYFSAAYEYDPIGNLINTLTDEKEHHYSYDCLSQLSSEQSALHSLTYAHDSLYNRTQTNDEPQPVNALNETLASTYDLNGNQTLKHTPTETFQLAYDPLNRLIEASSPQKKLTFAYDPLGRRINKTVQTTTFYGSWKEPVSEHYLYNGQDEIGAFTSNHIPKNLKIPGLSTLPISIELNGKAFAPILDAQRNIRRLIDPNKRTTSYDYTAFGQEPPSQITSPNPWRFAAKRTDPDLNLIYFGKRDYDPSAGRWLTPDPAGFIDSANLYQYVFNNPFRYTDLDGQFAFVIPLLIWGAEAALPSLSAVVMPLIYGAAITGVVGYGAYKLGEALNAIDDRYYANYANYSMQFKAECEEKKKKKDVRTEPDDLSEQLTLEEAKAKPQNPTDEIMQGKIKDPRYPADEWKKVQHIHERPDGTNIDVHYWENRNSGEKTGFKFKD